MHVSLKPAFNLALMGLYGMAIVATLLWGGRVCLPAMGAGLVLGALLGDLQRRALTAGSMLVLAAGNSLDVRRAMTRTRSGRRYVRWLWASFAVVLMVAFLTARAIAPVAYLGGLAVMCFVREAMTLRTTFKLVKRQRFGLMMATMSQAFEDTDASGKPASRRSGPHL